MQYGTPRSQEGFFERMAHALNGSHGRHGGGRHATVRRSSGIASKVYLPQLVPAMLLVAYNGHAGIYIGNGQMVNAMNPTQGVAVCSIYAITNGNMLIHRIG